MIHRLLIAAALAVPLTLAAARISVQAEPQPPGIQANYHGRGIDLSDGWGSAQACATDGITAECFDNEAELDTYLADEATGDQAATGADAALATCGTSTRLYAGTSYGTPVLAITQRLSWVNLGPLGFDNVTRSYKVGACASLFAKNSGGGGGFFPGNTGAGAQSSTMATGWDRAVSSVYLY